VSAAGDNADGVRRRNLSTVLQLVHRGVAPTRADVTTITGLNRSTVGALVAELATLGLVVEREPSATRKVGRPSPTVHLGTEPVVVAINPEVDAVTAAVVGLGARVQTRVRRELDHAPTPREAVELITELVEQLQRSTSARVFSIGLAVPGLVRTTDGLVRWAPHLNWREVPFAALVEEATGIPTFAGNDASLGTMAERWFGAGRGVDELVYLNGGASGIGGGVVSGGVALGGAHGYAGEFGQNRPGVQDPTDRATEHGTLEDEVSRTRLLTALGLPGADEPELRAAVLGATSPKVLAEIARQQRVLAVALANAVNVLNPTLVVLGGFLADLLAKDAPTLERYVEAATVPAAWEGVSILPAALGEDRLLIGAAELAFAPLLADPASLGRSSRRE
jgi:predicted NBD/HSP70 family sugar kinase